MGTVVNVAARVEAACRQVGYDIVISDTVHNTVRDRLAVLDAGAVPLKGTSGLTQLYIVVGDEELAADPEFAKLRSAHGRLIERISDGSGDRAIGEALAECTRIGRALEPGLIDFFHATAKRAGDFAIPAHSAA